MHPERWKKIKEVMDLALEQPLQKRAEFLREFCGTDTELHREVLSFLDYEDIENGFLEEEKLSAAKFSESETNDFVGRKIGKYEITDELGVGGMGAVFRAERSDGEFAQTVAVKFLRQSFLTKDAKRRFAQERQILAKLKHPFIAQLIDGGTTEDGTPYLVMELIEGTPITKYAEETPLSLDEKLKLFRNVCRAVSFAHQNFVVHRDLKPDNILITQDGTPKLLDFGIAKLFSETEANLTATRFQPFTPEYAAPEQIANQIISAASDVYSLGVILYELLTGAKPYQIKSNNSLVAINSLFDKEPTRPSAVGYSKFPKEKTNYNELNENPKSKIQNLKSLKGDLDTILLKSLKKNPSERYASVENFSEDIRRYQEGLPISALPDTFLYRASKFIKRNKIASIAGVLIFAALTFGISIALYQARQAQFERARAEQRFEETRSLAKAVIFNYYDEINKLAGATKVRSMMINDALKYLDNLANDSSATKDATLRLELAEGYIRLADVQGQPYGDNLGDSQAALQNYKKALNLLENAPTEDLAFMKARANALQKMSLMFVRVSDGREKSIQYAEESTKLFENIAVIEPTTENKKAYAESFQNLGWQISSTGNYEESIEILRRGATMTDELARSEPNNPDLKMLGVRFNGRIGFHLSEMASQEMFFWNEGKAREIYESSVPFFEKAIADAKSLAAADPNKALYARAIGVNESNLADVLTRLGRTDEALKLQTEVLSYQKNILDTDPTNREIKFPVAEDYFDLAITHLYRSDKQKAQENFERGMQLMDELIKADPQNIEFSQFQFNNFTLLYGNTQLKTGDYEGAIDSYKRALEKSMNYAADSPNLKRERNFTVKKGFGDIYRFKAEKEKGAAKKKDFLTARDFYRESLDLLAPDNNFDDKTFAYLNEKIAECDQVLSSF